jgi:hypothetical protein
MRVYENQSISKPRGEWEELERLKSREALNWLQILSEKKKKKA